MNAAPPDHLDDSELDRRIRSLGYALDEITPPPPHFDELRRDERPGVSRLVPAAAAVVLVIAGVTAVALTGKSDERPDAPAQQLPASAPPTPTPYLTSIDASQTGPLLRTRIEASVTPLIELPGWNVTYAYSDDGQPLGQGGFEGALVLIGDGPRYDAPLFAATTITRPEPSRTEPIATAPLENPELDLATLGEPVDVAGTTGYASSTPTNPETQLAGPIVTVFWELDETRYVRVNAVRLTVDQTVALIDQLGESISTGTAPITPPSGYHYVALPDHDQHRTFEFQYEHDGRTLQVNGANRGIVSLLGRIAGEVRTTEVIDGVEVANRPLPGEPGRYWVDWQLGDWSFYARGEGFDTDEQFFATLASLEVVDQATFDAAAGTDGIVTPDDRAATIERLLAGVPLPPGFDTAQVASAGGANARYQEIARVSGAVACGWLDIWFDATETGDDDTAQQAADALATSTNWPMLNEIADQGGWAQAVWEYADAVNGGSGVITGNGPTAPTRELAQSGLGCNFG